jgi:leucyl aminopeptidase
LSKKEKQLLEDLLIQSFYNFNKYRKENKIDYTLLIQDKNREEKDFENLKNSIYFTRDLINEPSNVINPETMEETIKRKFKSKVKIKIFYEEDLKKE